MAASTSFDESKRREIEETNVTGTENLLNIAGSIKSLKNLFYISTAYVCGTDQGVIPEERLDLSRAFKNPYEESKLNCEELVRTSGLPFTVIRPSIIMGHSRTGDAMGEDRMVYGYQLGVYYSALYNFEPPRDKNFWDYWKSSNGEPKTIRTRLRADGNTTKNLVTLDDVVNVSMAIRNSDDNASRTYNVVNPKNVTVKQIIDTMQRTLHIQGIEYIPNLPKEDIKCESGTQTERLAYRQTEPYWPYVHNMEPTWKYDNVSALGVKRVEMTPNLLDFLLTTYVNKYLVPKE